eukprot:CAMPEP_0170197294 /NCGR_PEP_ID=MMETSP0040_2-20121228/66048_1 /TAXON_ID=641309 /ORGANISM="Lotharella oceanica, Strain CCMP622" /LENGTH=147 /DNA_ID=CAMNT_0010446937 /DNA_START=75 /DNA_END=515 /DNA_ORIENTATION=+
MPGLPQAKAETQGCVGEQGEEDTVSYGVQRRECQSEQRKGGKAARGRQLFVSFPIVRSGRYKCTLTAEADMRVYKAKSKSGDRRRSNKGLGPVRLQLLRAPIRREDVTKRSLGRRNRDCGLRASEARQRTCVGEGLLGSQTHKLLRG